MKRVRDEKRWKVRDATGRLIGSAPHTGTVAAIVRAHVKAHPGAVLTADTEYDDPPKPLVWPVSRSADWFDNGVRLEPGRRPEGF